MTKKQTGLQMAIDESGHGISDFAHKLEVSPKLVRKWLAADVATPRAVTTVDLAVEKAGGATALARALGVTPQSVWDWLVKGYVPLARAKEIEMQFGIPRNDLVSAKVRSNLGLGGDL